MAFLYQRHVAFADTDAAGVVHFSRLLCYVEEAEHALLAELGIPVMGEGGWPRVLVECTYFAPLGPEDDVEVILIPDKIGRSSVCWNFAVLRDGQDMAKGLVKTVRVGADGKSAELSDDWRDLLANV